MSDNSDSSNIIYTSTNNTSTNIDNWIATPYTYVDIGTCSVCNKETNILCRYSWNNKKECERAICHKCNCKALDKLYGIPEKRIKTEETLFGNKSE